MSAAAARNLAISLILTSLVALLALGGCGTSPTRVCNLSSGDCCGPGVAACPATSFIFANGVDGQIYIFVTTISMPGTPTTVSGPTNSLGLAAMNNQFLYASNPPAILGGTGTGSIDAWAISPGTTTLTPLPNSPFSLEPLSVPTGLAVNNAAQVLYVGDVGKIDALQADATGALTPIVGSPFPAGTNLYLAIDPMNRFLFASDDTTPGNVLAFTIGATGALTAVPGSPFPTIPGYVGNTQPRPITVDPTGSFVYTGLFTTGQIAAFSIDASSGQLTQVPGSPFSAGNGPVSLLAVGSFLYVSNVQDGTLSGYSIDPTSGALTPLANSPFPIKAGPLVASPFGGYLYTAGAGGLMTFSINPQTGALTQVGSAIPFAGSTVLTFAF